MECQPQNPEFRINPENYHPCNKGKKIKWGGITSACYYLIPPKK